MLIVIALAAGVAGLVAGILALALCSFQLRSASRELRRQGLAITDLAKEQAKIEADLGPKVLKLLEEDVTRSVKAKAKRLSMDDIPF